MSIKTKEEILQFIYRKTKGTYHLKRGAPGFIRIRLKRGKPGRQEKLHEIKQWALGEIQNTDLDFDFRNYQNGTLITAAWANAFSSCLKPLPLFDLKQKEKKTEIKFWIAVSVLFSAAVAGGLILTVYANDLMDKFGIGVP